MGETDSMTVGFAANPRWCKMVGILGGLTTFVNWLFMVLALWLGLFVVTRSPRRLVSWLAGVAVWSGTLYFAARVVYLHADDLATSGLAIKALSIGTGLFPAALLHLSLLLLPERARRKIRLPVIVVDSFALLFILLAIATDHILFPLDDVPRVYNSGKGAGVLYPFFISYILITAAFSFSILYRLWLHERRGHLKPQLGLLSLSTSLVLPGGLFLGLSTAFRLDTPTLLGDVVLAASILLLGYSVSKWNALVEGRVIELDFVYTFLLIAAMAGVYFLSMLLLFGTRRFNLILVLVVVALAIISHFTYDWARTFLDRFFYQRQFRELRANLRNFAREAGTGRGLEGHLTLVLSSLCKSFSTPLGFIALRARDGVEIRDSSPSTFAVGDDEWLALTLPQATVLTASERTGRLAGISVLIPLMVRGEHVGALALGDKVPGASYTGEEMELLDDLADQLAAVINTALLQENHLRRIDSLVSEYREREREVQRGVQALLAPEEEVDFPIPGELEREDFIEAVEQTLRRLHDVSYLGQHVLASLRVVEDLLPKAGEPVTHLDRGRALREVLLGAIAKLKPNQVEPKLPTRDWHPYIVVHDAYVVGESNREIMSKLYISEGTFNRTRRRAILAVARALGEIERRQA